MARTTAPAPHGPHGPHGPAPRRVRPPPAGNSPAAAVLAALSGEPAGATVAVIAARAGISVPAARQALIAHKKAGIGPASKAVGPASPTHGRSPPRGPRPATRRPRETPARTAPPPPGTARRAPARQPLPSRAAPPKARKPQPAPRRGRTRRVTAGMAGNVLAITQAVDEAGKALAAGDLAALDAVREQAAQGGGSSGRRTARRCRDTAAARAARQRDAL